MNRRGGGDRSNPVPAALSFPPRVFCGTMLVHHNDLKRGGTGDGTSEVLSRVGPVDKSKNSAETHRFSGRTLELEIEKDSIYHSFKV